MSRPEHHVYFAKCVGMVGPIKIGCSRFPPERAITLSTWAPFPVEIIASIPGNYKLEKRLHGHFADLHSHSEWFHAGAPLLDLIERLKAGRPIGEIIDLNVKPARQPNVRRRTPEERQRQSELMKATWARFRENGWSWRHNPTGRGAA